MVDPVSFVVGFLQGILFILILLTAYIYKVLDKLL